MKWKPGTNCTSSQWGQILARAPESSEDFICHQEMACIVSNTETYRSYTQVSLLQQFSWLLLTPVPSLAPKQCQMFFSALVMRSSWQCSTALSTRSHTYLLQTRFPIMLQAPQFSAYQLNPNSCSPQSQWERVLSINHDLPSSCFALQGMRQRVPSMSHQRSERDMKH